MVLQTLSVFNLEPITFTRRISGGGGMNSTRNHTSTLLRLAEFVYQQPSAEDLSQRLAFEVCPTGELAKVYLGRVDNDGVIRTISSFGYPLAIDVMGISIPLDADRPAPDAVRRQRVVLGSREVIEAQYSGFAHIDPQSPWRSLVAVPTAGRLIATFHLLCDMDDPDRAALYFQLIGAILSFYQYEELRPLNQRSGLGKVVEQENPVIARMEVGRPLTERQQMILSMIKELKSNPQIAALMGYSESLIRQETIIIYKKLGVSGRNEILGR